MAEVDLREYYERMAGKRKQYHGGNVWFERKWVPDTQESERQGKVVEKEMDFVVVQYPGKAAEPVLADENHKKEYPEQWAAFQKGLEPPVVGFPLTQWAMMPRDTTLELATKGFKTVENLAECTDEVKRKIGSLAQWCKKAKKFLEAAGTGQNEVVRLQEQMESMEIRNRKLEDQIVMLFRRLEAETGEKFVEPSLSKIDEHIS